MGTLKQKAICQDCSERIADEEDIYGTEVRERASFWITMEHMKKQELIQHIKSKDCPDCNSENWILTDESRM